MPVIVIAPDKFKGSLAAPAVCVAIAAGLRRVWPDAALRACPMADGGDGTLDAILSRGGERRTAPVAGADGTARPVPYGLLRDVAGDIAFIEAASIVGLFDDAGMRVPVMQRTTRGTGELMRILLDAGVRRFMVGLGGSSTNDGGVGLLAALGLRLFDASGAPIAATPDGLARLARLDATGLEPRLGSCEFTVLSDVDNPLCGPRGATAIFGPQKGVSTDAIAALDRSLCAFAILAEGALGRRAADTPGAGAAGGLGFALLLLGARLAPGADVVADLIGLDQALAGADWLITGEGRSDTQTLAGKAPWIAARRAHAAAVPATLLAGAIDPAALPALGAMFAGCFALPDGPLSLDASLTRVEALLADRAEQIGRLWRAANTARGCA